jgi:membrane protein
MICGTQKQMNTQQTKSGNDNHKTHKQKKSIFKTIWKVLKASAREWSDNHPFRHSAVIAFYSIFSMPALLLIIVTVAGFFWGKKEVTGTMYNEITLIIGPKAAEMIEVIVDSASEKEESTLMFFIGLGVLFFGSTTIFYHLQMSLNTIWGVTPHPRKKILKHLKDRMFSFGIILCMAFLMLISLILTAVLAATSKWLESHIADFLLVVFHLANIIFSVGVNIVLFALIFRFLPDAIISWKAIWKGAILSALLFELGKYLLGVLFLKFDPASAYGNAGAIVIILIWISYVCLALLFGAVFTLQWAKILGHRISPKGSAKFAEIKHQYDNI